jgi:hypothetical protein
VIFFCVLSVVINWGVTKEIYGFSYKEMWDGFVYNRNRSLHYFLGKRAFNPKPMAIFWLAGTNDQYITFIKKMCQERRVIRWDKNWDNDFSVAKEACKQKFNNVNVWPSQEIAEFCDDPNGWWPGKKIV